MCAIYLRDKFIIIIFLRIVRGRAYVPSWSRGKLPLSGGFGRSVFCLGIAVPFLFLLLSLTDLTRTRSPRGGTIGTGIGRHCTLHVTPTAILMRWSFGTKRKENGHLCV